MTYQTPDPKDAPQAVRAYVYAGEWVGDCTRPPDPMTHKGCANTEFLFRPSMLGGPRDQMLPFFICSYCGHQAAIEWPRHRDEIFKVLSVRPLPHTRNWYPADHPVAVSSRTPHGQSVRELIAESLEHGISEELLKGVL